jgi:hypothetical protein
MADKPKSKSASQGKAKAAKPANGKTAKSADAAPAASKAAAPKTATAKTAAKAGKKGKPKAGKAAGGSHAAKPSKSAALAAEKQVEKDVETHAPAPAETFYVCSGVLPIEIRDRPPASGTRFVEFASFAAARDHFLDELIAAIEHSERVLHAVRGTTSFAHYLAQHG